MSTVQISDHALLRFIERVKGFDLNGLRTEIRKIVGPAVRVGASKVTAGGFTYHLSPDGTVITVHVGKSPKVTINLRRPEERA